MELLRGKAAIVTGASRGIGLGIAFVPDFCIPADESQLYILKLAQSLPARKLVVASNGSVPLSQAAKQFMDML